MVSSEGATLLAVGDVHQPTYGRSALKPYQAAGMLDAGLDLDGELLALAAASHWGEEFHQEGVRRILAGAGLTVADLQNTPDDPIGDDPYRRWVQAGHGPEAIAANCSGKHAAMLRTCVRAGWDPTTYRDPDHPLQVRLRESTSRYAGNVLGVTVDGCGAPAFATSLVGLARAFGTFGGATEGPLSLVAAAYRAHPEYVSGTDSNERDLHGAIGGLVCKGGAEGVLGIGLPDGTGIALKILDGARRGTTELAVGIIAWLGYGTADLEALATSPVLGHGEPVGEVRISGALAGLLAERSPG